jgi:hypothetical protein
LLTFTSQQIWDEERGTTLVWGDFGAIKTWCFQEQYGGAWEIPLHRPADARHYVHGHSSHFQRCRFATKAVSESDDGHGGGGSGGSGGGSGSGP